MIFNMKIRRTYINISILIISSFLFGYNLNCWLRKGKMYTDLSTNLIEFVKPIKDLDKYDYYFFFITSPMDCGYCNHFLISMEFIDNLKSSVIFRDNKISLNFLINGNLEKFEKKEFIKPISSCVNTVILDNNDILNSLQKVLNTSYTPVLIILNHDKVIKYWQTFHVTGIEYETPYINLINTLERML